MEINSGYDTLGMLSKADAGITNDFWWKKKSKNSA